AGRTNPFSSRRLQPQRLEQKRVCAVQLRWAEDAIGEEERDVGGECAVEVHRLRKAKGRAVDLAGFERRPLIKNRRAGERFFVELRAILIASDECAPLLLDLAQQERKRVVIRKLLLNCGERCDRSGGFAALHLLQCKPYLIPGGLCLPPATRHPPTAKKLLVVP